MISAERNIDYQRMDAMRGLVPHFVEMSKDSTDLRRAKAGRKILDTFLSHAFRVRMKHGATELELANDARMPIRKVRRILKLTRGTYQFCKLCEGHYLGHPPFKKSGTCDKCAGVRK